MKEYLKLATDLGNEYWIKTKRYLKPMLRKCQQQPLQPLGWSCVVVGIILLMVSVRFLTATDSQAFQARSYYDAQPESLSVFESPPDDRVISSGSDGSKNYQELLADLDNNLKAEAVHIYDLSHQLTVFSRNEYRRLPLASITKLLTGAVASEILPEYKTVTITDKHLKTYGNSGLRVDDVWRNVDLRDISSVASVNDAAFAIAIAAGAYDNEDIENDDYQEAKDHFVGLMNKKAEQIGMDHSFFFNPTGLDSNKVDDGARGSAYDVTQLLKYLWEEHPEQVESTTEREIEKRSVLGTVHKVKNTNPLVEEIPGIKMSKTGYTLTAGGNLAIVFEPIPDQPVAVTVLGSTFEHRYTDVAYVVERLTEYYSKL